MKQLKTKRVTKTRLLKLVNEALDRYEAYFTGVSIEKSRFRSADYESGAWCWRVKLKCKDGQETVLPLYLYCFFHFREFQGCVEGTDILTLRNMNRTRLNLLSEHEIWYQKK